MDFDLSYCGKCGYDLTGLPDQGACPECGQRYDAATREGLATAASGNPRTNWVMRHLRTLCLAVAAIMVLMCCGALSLVASNPIRVVATGGFIAMVILFGALASYIFENNPD